MKKVLLLYIPVLHAGYLKLFKKYGGNIDCLYILGKDISEEFAFFEEEIRAIDPETMKVLVESLSLFKSVQILDLSSLERLRGANIITAKEGVVQRLIEKHFKGEAVVFDTVFLRWDEESVATQEPINHDKISTDIFDREMIALASKEGAKTSDWWRKVGAVVVKDGEIIITAHNTHVPSEHSPYVHGDIRDFIEPGKHSDTSSALHSEKCVITEAARKVLEGTSIYLTVFPCPDCAKIIAYSGIKKCYFSSGHASFDGEKILKQQGVELIFVEK